MFTRNESVPELAGRNGRGYLPEDHSELRSDVLSRWIHSFAIQSARAIDRNDVTARPSHTAGENDA